MTILKCHECCSNEWTIIDDGSIVCCFLCENILNCSMCGCLEFRKGEDNKVNCMGCMTEYKNEIDKSTFINKPFETQFNNYSIYVLKCKEDKYYIGKTQKDVNIRFQEHVNNNTCSFTQKYNPIEICEIIKTKDALDEDKITKKYMMKYGIENVRGGSYTKLELEDWQIKSLKHEFVAMSDLCYKCNEKGHFAKDCSKKIFNMEEYLKKYNTKEEIQEAIDQNEYIYDKILYLKKEINKTEIVNSVDFNQLNKINEYRKKMEDLQKNQSSNQYPMKKNKYGTRETYNEIQELSHRIGEHEQKINTINCIFFNVFKKYHDKNDYNFGVKFYKLVDYYYKNKEELEILLEKEGSEEIIINKICKLYEKKIKLFKSTKN